MDGICGTILLNKISKIITAHYCIFDQCSIQHFFFITIPKLLNCSVCCQYFHCTGGVCVCGFFF